MTNPDVSVPLETLVKELEEELTELVRAIRMKTDAEIQIERLNSYPRKSASMQTDINNWYNRKIVAMDTIKRISTGRA